MNAVVKILAPFGLLLLAALLAFWPTLFAFHERWASSELGYSHGYPVLALSLYALYERRGNFYQAMGSPILLGLVVLIVLSLGWFFANVIQVRIGQQILLPLVILAWVGAVFGLKALRVVAIPLALIYLAVPFWDFLTTPLRVATVAVVQSLLEMAALPALIDGYFISVPGGKFVVAGGCSGLNYVLTSLTLGVFYSLLYLKTFSRRLSFILVCVAFSLIVNWVRVFALVLIGLYTDMQSEMVHDHETFGWVLFSIVLIPMFWIASRLEQSEIKLENAASSAAAKSESGTEETAQLAQAENTETADLSLDVSADQTIENVDTEGNFEIKGFAKGALSETTIPNFVIDVVSNNASVKYPDLPKRIKDINLRTTLANITGNTEDTYLDINKLFRLKSRDLAWETKKRFLEKAKNGLTCAFRVHVFLQNIAPKCSY